MRLQSKGMLLDIVYFYMYISGPSRGDPSDDIDSENEYDSNFRNEAYVTDILISGFIAIV